MSTLERDLIAALEDIISIPLGADAEVARGIARDAIQRIAS